MRVKSRVDIYMQTRSHSVTITLNFERFDFYGRFQHCIIPSLRFTCKYLIEYNGEREREERELYVYNLCICMYTHLPSVKQTIYRPLNHSSTWKEVQVINRSSKQKQVYVNFKTHSYLLVNMLDLNELSILVA